MQCLKASCDETYGLESQLHNQWLYGRNLNKEEEEVKEENYYCCERSHGSFARVIELPAEVKADQAKASFKNGVLEIRVPKTEEAKKKTTRIKID